MATRAADDPGIIAAMGAPERWTDAQIIAAIQAWGERYGRPPRISDWRYAGDLPPDLWPHAATAIRRFGSWNAAIEAAGFEPCRVRGHWTEEMILDAIQRWNATHGRPPVRREWVRVPHGFPPTTTVASRFGTWNKAIEAAGLKPRRPGRHPADR